MMPDNSKSKKKKEVKGSKPFYGHIPKQKRLSKKSERDKKFHDFSLDHCFPSTSWEIRQKRMGEMVRKNRFYFKSVEEGYPLYTMTNPEAYFSIQKKKKEKSKGLGLFGLLGKVLSGLSYAKNNLLCLTLIGISAVGITHHVYSMIKTKPTVQIERVRSKRHGNYISSVGSGHSIMFNTQSGQDLLLGQFDSSSFSLSSGNSLHDTLLSKAYANNETPSSFIYRERIKTHHSSETKKLTNYGIHTEVAVPEDSEIKTIYHYQIKPNFIKFNFAKGKVPTLHMPILHGHNFTLAFNQLLDYYIEGLKKSDPTNLSLHSTGDLMGRKILYKGQPIKAYVPLLKECHNLYVNDYPTYARSFNATDQLPVKELHHRLIREIFHFLEATKSIFKIECSLVNWENKNESITFVFNQLLTVRDAFDNRRTTSDAKLLFRTSVVSNIFYRNVMFQVLQAYITQNLLQELILLIPFIVVRI